jgi:subfamily B ATP-binding cassette protein MsbA
LALGGALVIVLTINARLTLFVLTFGGLLMFATNAFGKRLQKASSGLQDQLADSTIIAEEALQGIRVVKSFGREQYEMQRYKSALKRALHTAIEMAASSSLFSSLAMFFGFSFIAAITWYGGREVIAGRLTLPMITGFLIYGIVIANNLAGLANLFGQVRAGIGGVQRVFEILDLESSVQDTPGAKALPCSQGRIAFEKVSFSYDRGVPVIDEMILEIEPGEILALVGPSGAGKSTMFNLIPRFYDPTSGRLFIDGYDLRSVTQASLRKQISIVPQETMLFGGTIYENILYGNLDASPQEVALAARAANAHEFVQQLPNKYETVVGERGIKLSGGERQRVAVARAVLKDPRILLLDEATNALDSESERLVQDAVNKLMVGRTTLVIAHRLSTIKLAHRIAVMNRGRLVELGTHEELMRRSGLYSRLYLMQFRYDGRELQA